MSIIITNVSENHGLEYGKGKQVYHLKINRTLKCVFGHDFEEGLSTCLRKAADEFDRSESEGRGGLYLSVEEVQEFLERAEIEGIFDIDT